MPSRQTPRQTRRRRADPAPEPASGSDSDHSSDDEVTFKTASHASSADDSVSTLPADPQDDISTVAGSDDDDEAPESVGLADARQEAEALLKDLADSRQRRDDSRRQRDQERQQRNREQKLDKQRRLELELSQELMDELAEELAEEEKESAGGKVGKESGVVSGVRKSKKKRFKYPTPAATGALDFIPLTEGESTEFKAAALPVSALPAVVNPQLMGLRERLLYSGRIPRTSARGLKQIRHKQAVSGKYDRR